MYVYSMYVGRYIYPARVGTHSLRTYWSVALSVPLCRRLTSQKASFKLTGISMRRRSLFKCSSENRWGRSATRRRPGRRPSRRRLVEHAGSLQRRGTMEVPWSAHFKNWFSVSIEILRLLDPLAGLRDRVDDYRLTGTVRDWMEAGLGLDLAVQYSTIY